MEGAVLSTQSGSSFRAHLKNAANSLCTRTLPKHHQRHDDVSVDVVAAAAVCGEGRHHTYPRATTPRRAALSCRLELEQADADTIPAVEHFCFIGNIDQQPQPNATVKLRGSLSREVAAVWNSRVGSPDQPAPADRVQSLFNDIELYPTKTQVFEMLVCARQCARRKSLTLTFGEFCVFAAELRKCARQARQVSKQPDPESPQPQNVDVCKHTVNGSEGTPSPCEVFLGGSCNPTTWRSDIAIPMLNKMGITYFNPQVEDWSTELMEVEHRAKAAARALLFVLDSETRAVAASVEAAYLAASPRDLLLVLRPYVRNQKIGKEIITDHEYVELSRGRSTLQEVVERRGLPAFSDIPAALRCARAVVRGARTLPRHPLSHTILRLRRAFDAHRPRPALARATAVAALADLTRRSAALVERALPTNMQQIDFETFCAAVAELAASSDAGRQPSEEVARSQPESPRPLHSYNERLRACGRKLGIVIPKNESRRPESEESNSDSVFTPGTEQRLDRLPSMLNTNSPQIYIAGTFPSISSLASEHLGGAGVRWVLARANDYSRMFSVTAPRRAADHPPESPRNDKKPRADRPRPDRDADVTLRTHPDPPSPNDRLSASDFYTVTDDVTPQPFKGTYDDELISDSHVLVFALSSETPSFSTMVLAAHYLGLRPSDVILLVQPMKYEPGSLYSECAVKDYNRGRHYLTDLARRVDVPVFENATDALHAALQRLTPHDTHT